MIVMSFDIATHTGVAVGRVGETPRATAINLGVGKSQGARYAKAVHSARYLLAKHNPDLIVYESPIGGKNTSQFLVGLSACFVAEIHLAKKPYHKLNIATVRKHFLGRHFTVRDFPGLSQMKAKAAIKQQVIGRCELLGWPVRNDDEADAMACWDFACATYGNGQSAPLGGLFNG